MQKVEFGDDCDKTFSKRENQKRKGVRFEESATYEDIIVETITTTSTAAFLHEQGIGWDSLAEAFNCQDDKGQDENAVMTELLDLCSWWADHEQIFKGDVQTEEDEDDEDWLGSLSDCLTEQSIKVLSSVQNWTRDSSVDSTVVGRTSSGFDVNNLRLSSLLHIDTRTNDVVKKKSELIRNLQTEKEELEKAFQGIMTNDNEVSQDGIIDAPAPDIDFWDDVEF